MQKGRKKRPVVSARQSRATKVPLQPWRPETVTLSCCVSKTKSPARKKKKRKKRSEQGSDPARRENDRFGGKTASNELAFFAFGVSLLKHQNKAEACLSFMQMQQRNTTTSKPPLSPEAAIILPEPGCAGS